MTLELHGHRRNAGNEWEPWRLTVTRDGKVPEISPTTQLDDASHGAVLEWASRLPSRRTTPSSERAAHPPPRGIDAFTLTGTLTLGTTSHPVRRGARATTRLRRPLHRRGDGAVQALADQPELISRSRPSPVDSSPAPAFQRTVSVSW